MKKGTQPSDLPEEYKQQALLQIGNQPTRSVAKLERNSCNKSVETQEATGRDRQYGFTSPVRISYRDTRRRLIDSDNGWTKYWTDALISSSILVDDSTKEIPERPSVEQRKAEEGQEESLVIIVELIRRKRNA